ncbi:MAG: hypothetical protein IPH32_16420 [Bacteroidetes bacterium]|nr:hypothetical protein [Bacteroidota bacterium]
MLLRKIYFLNNNLPINERIRFIPIDIVSINNMESNDILQYYEDKKNRNLVQVDLDILQSINKRTSKKTKIKLYKNFQNRLLENRGAHISYLGVDNYTKIENYLIGLNIYIND